MDLFGADLVQRAAMLLKELDGLALPDRVEALNALRRELHAYSPFSAEPVDLVEWCKGMSFTQHRSEAYQKYLDLMRRRKAEWGVLNGDVPAQSERAG